jgi:glycine/D-amino acid oxidase-like deaminating enzyme
MKQITDVIVIGAGIIGCAIAHALTRGRTRRVILVEKGPLVSGMTRRNPGLVHSFHPHPGLNRLANESYAFYREWAVQLGGKSAFVETGATLVAAVRAPQPARATGSAPPDALPGERLQTVRTTPHAGYADPVLAAQAMVAAAKESGLQVHTGAQVRQILFEKSQIQGVATTTGTIQAPTVIVAAGGWSERLLAPLGVTLHLGYRRGTVIFYEQPGPQELDFPIVLDATGMFIRPHPYRMLAAGSSPAVLQNASPERLDELVSPDQVRVVTDLVRGGVPIMTNPIPKRAHTILYDTPADGLPALGKTHVEGLYSAVGFGTSAFAVAPAVGETIARMLINADIFPDTLLFSPQRPSLK